LKIYQIFQIWYIYIPVGNTVPTYILLEIRDGTVQDFSGPDRP